MELSKYLREYSRSIAGKEQLIISAFAKALEIIPRQLCDNAGFDSTSVLNKLRQKHATGKPACFFLFKFVANLFFFFLDGGGGGGYSHCTFFPPLDFLWHCSAFKCKTCILFKMNCEEFQLSRPFSRLQSTSLHHKINFWEFLINFSHRYSQGNWSGVTQYKNL